MEQMTVNELFKDLEKLIKRGYGNHKIILANDNEGNGYHGMFFSVTEDVEEVRASIEVSNGLYDSVETDPEKLVILG